MANFDIKRMFDENKENCQAAGEEVVKCPICDSGYVRIIFVTYDYGKKEFEITFQCENGRHTFELYIRFYEGMTIVKGDTNQKLLFKVARG